jgi:acetyl esterase
MNAPLTSVSAFLEMLAAGPQFNYETLTAQDAREAYDTPIPYSRQHDITETNRQIKLFDRLLDARLYQLRDGNGDGLTVFCHGGGWVMGKLDTYDHFCRRLAAASGHKVLSVAYRLAPEHRYPAAFEDCFDVLVWASENSEDLGFDRRKLAIAGDSAGGNLAAAAAFKANSAGGPKIAYQALFYPIVDFDFETESHRRFGGGDYFLSTTGMKWFWRQYLGKRSPDDAPWAYLAKRTDFAGLPPATIIVAECDPIHDEAVRFARAMEDNEIEVDLLRAPGMIHGFCTLFPLIPEAELLIDRAASKIARAFDALGAR